jgi:GntR family transcriptional repressor for pyruvate dehydrogenase complex
MSKVSNDETFSNIVKINISGSVIERIEEMIVSNELVPGMALPSERVLAEKLGISRNALREALGILQQKGLISVLPGRGTFVTEPNSGQMKNSLDLLLRMGKVSLSELSDARLLIEPELARMAAKRRAVDKRGLSVFLDELRDSATNAKRHVQADIDFHSEIARIANHGVYEAIVEAVREPVTKSMVFGTRVPRAINTSDKQHTAIHDAILAGDGDAAWKHMHDHMIYVRDYIAANSTENEKRSPKDGR